VSKHVKEIVNILPKVHYIGLAITSPEKEEKKRSKQRGGIKKESG
jgi:hypothetical protein